MRLFWFIVLAAVLSQCAVDQPNPQDLARNDLYISNQAPLIAAPYSSLNLGDIKPEGWLLHMLELQRDGLTGHLDSIYELVCGPNNGWLGGSGDGWERGPYWLDGLVPLAYLLDDEQLKAKAQPWIEWSLKNQRESGYFGPIPVSEDAPRIKGTQQGMSEDWWPKMVMLKVLQQYYSATGDGRVLTLMDGYFRYQLSILDEYPLGHWTFWANRRGGDNLAIVYWYYNIVEEPYLLELGEKIHSQTFDWTTIYSGDTLLRANPWAGLHCVNVAQGLKEPLIFYQQHPEEKYSAAVRSGLNSLHDVHGFVTGMYGADEAMHGNDPIQGVEFCSIVEMMYSFENILPITGDLYYADYLEKLAFNALPSQHDDHFTRRQYFQQTNQVKVSNQERNFHNDHYARTVFGVETGYPCCLCNMHQGWPKFIQNLWYATADNGIAALVYGPSNVTAKVAGGAEIRISEKTEYPFSEQIKFHLETDEDVTFPFHLRIPEWCKVPVITINGEDIDFTIDKHLVVLDRTWKSGDVLELVLPMEIRTSKWFQGSTGVERGPLIFALRMEEDWKELKSADWPNTYFEVVSEDPWNYGLYGDSFADGQCKIDLKGKLAEMPWNVENAPVSIRTKASRIPSWTLYNNSTGTLPSPSHTSRSFLNEIEEITLIPYGCTTLRIAQFPLIRGKP